MASFGEQLLAAQKAHRAASALDDAARKQVSDMFDQWEAGTLTNQTVRHRLEAIIRSSYRASAAIAAKLAMDQSGISGWKPQEEIFRTDYLTALIKDIQRNLREYKDSPMEDTDRRRAVLRMQLGATVAAQRGYTDATIASYKELSDFGIQTKKVWVANFADHTPCAECAALHGEVVGLEDAYKDGEDGPNVFDTLPGPPLHPRCQCYIVVLVVALENALETVDLENPAPPASTLTSDEVKSMPSLVFTAIVKTLKKILAFVKGS